MRTLRILRLVLQLIRSLNVDALSGWKTYIAAAIAAATAVNKVLHVFPPEVEDLLMKIAIALGLYGLRMAIANQKG